MRRVLVDTGALVALVRVRDKYHALVAGFFGEFLSGDLITTLPVLTEAMLAKIRGQGPEPADASWTRFEP